MSWAVIVAMLLASERRMSFAGDSPAGQLGAFGGGHYTFGVGGSF